MKNFLLKYKIIIATLLLLISPSIALAVIPLSVNQGGTGNATFTVGDCLKGNGTAPLTSGTCGGTPGGLNLQVQYNNAGVFGGITGAVTNGTILNLTNPLLGGATITTSTVNGVTLTTGGSTASFLNANGVYSTPAGTVYTGTSNRITVTGTVIDIAGTYVGQSSITTLGTITTGTWTGTTIAIANGGTGATSKAAGFDALSPMTTGGDIIYGGASGTGTRLTNGSAGQVLTSAGTTLAPTWQTPATGTVTSVSGTSNRITSTGGATPVIDISASYVGQSSITTLGTITTGVWHGTAIANANLANSTISGISLGSNLNALTATNTTLTFSGSYDGSTARTVGLNLANTNTWTGQQTFNTTAPILGTITGGGNQCLHVNNSGLISGTGSDCGSGSGGITNTAPSGTVPLTIDGSGNLGASNIKNPANGDVRINEGEPAGTVLLSGSYALIQGDSSNTSLLSLGYNGSGLSELGDTQGSGNGTKFQADDTNIVLNLNVPGGTMRINDLSLATASNGMVWTLQDITTGEGAWVANGSGTVTSVSGTANRITSTGGATPVIDISASYVGQSSITTLGTITTGTWNGGVIAGQYGGTGVANTGKTITLGGNLTTSGAFASTFTMTNTTTVTFPTTGTLATLAGAESLTNKKLGSLTSNGLVTTSGGDGTLSVTVPGTGILTFLATPSSANLASAVTDETGSGALVFGTSPIITLNTASTAVTQGPADNSTKVATTAYVDNAILGQNFKEAVKYASVAVLPSIVYANGSSGVGATLTGVALAAISLDGASPGVGDRVLIKNQVSTFQNGIYVVTQTGSGIAVFILTRATDSDQATDWKTGDSVFVTAGNTLATTTWAYTGVDSPVMGTDALTFVQTAGQGSFTAGNGIAITGVSIAIDTAVTVDKTTAQALTNKSVNGVTLTSGGSSTTFLNGTGSYTTPSSNLVVGTSTIGSGTTTRILFDNAGVLGEYVISGTGNVAMTTSPVFTTPNLGTPSAVTLTNGTGLPIAGITGLGSGVDTWLATPSSANLAAAVTGETGTGALVFGTAPTISGATITTSTFNGVTLTTGGTATTFLNGAGSYTTPASGVGFSAQQIPLSVGTGTISSMLITSNTTATVMFMAFVQNNATTTMQIYRFEKDAISGNITQTNSTTLTITAGGSAGICVAGNFVYVSAGIGGTASLRRYAIADLSGVTTMSFSGTARQNSCFSDGTDLYIRGAASDTADRFTISGTTATNAGSVSFTSSALSSGAISNGTNVWALDSTNNSLSSGSSFTINKYALAGGAVVSSKNIQGNIDAYTGKLQPLQPLFMGSSTLLGIGYGFNVVNASLVTGIAANFFAITLP